jgi:hypothetical protein
MQSKFEIDINSRVKKLEDLVEQLFQENTLLRADFELVKNEGCWLSKQDADHLHGDIKYE